MRAHMFITTSKIPMISTTKALVKELRKEERQEKFQITDKEYLSLREAYVESISDFIEQCYPLKGIDVPEASFLKYHLQHTLKERAARGEIALRESKREDSDEARSTRSLKRKSRKRRKRRKAI